MDTNSVRLGTFQTGPCWLKCLAPFDGEGMFSQTGSLAVLENRTAVYFLGYSCGQPGLDFQRGGRLGVQQPVQSGAELEDSETVYRQQQRGVGPEQPCKTFTEQVR